ncbi:MAG: hypothetical protein PWR04_1201 [Anaerophaga sp.]|nr:hypothetical protein [Anaerophaga sp.]
MTIFVLNTQAQKAIIPLYEDTIPGNKVTGIKEIILPQGGHGFGFREESPAFEWTTHLAEWLHETVK